MRKSYVGIATPRGLEVFETENRDVCQFLIRRAYRSNREQSVCFWAVMDDAVARTVWGLMHAGCRLDALLIIQTLAIESGSLYPGDLESSVLSAG